VTREEIAEKLTKTLALVAALNGQTGRGWEGQAFESALKAASAEAERLARAYAALPTLSE